VAGYDELIAAAIAQTGLDDFGGDSFREGLQILMRSLQTEAHLNARGEEIIHPRLVGHLVNRLQVERPLAPHQAALMRGCRAKGR
jgi:hypothetical protein